MINCLHNIQNQCSENNRSIITYNIHASFTLKKSLHDFMNSVRCFVSISVLEVSVFVNMCEMRAHNSACRRCWLWVSVGIYPVIACKVGCTESDWPLLMCSSNISSEINKQAGSLHILKHHK